jgi:hypothetical protein
VFAVVLLAASCSGGDGGGGSVSIASPDDGARVQSPFDVTMQPDGFTVEPVGNVRDGAGHFHVMVDASCVAPGERIPDGAHRHFDDGASEAELDLLPGEHTLCLQAGDGAHAALDLTDEITITVVGAAGTATEAEGEAQKGPEEWKGAYTGSVVWDCGPIGTRRGTLEATFTIAVDEDGTATLKGPHTVTGSCAGPTTGRLTTPITVTGKRTGSGFTFPSTLWGPPGSFTITVTGDRGAGRLAGPAPGPATITLDFDVECVSC